MLENSKWLENGKSLLMTVAMSISASMEFAGAFFAEVVVHNFSFQLHM